MSDIFIERRGTAGIITLNKPDTLNALTHEMVLTIGQALDRWQDDTSVRHAVIRASGGRAFSAGGDIRDLYVRGQSDYPAMLRFFADEYRLDARIKAYPKPYIALIDGIVMGGGVGVSVNGSHRVGTENLRFAMPEVGIGFFPDVGGTYFLPRMPRRTGRFCALTASRLKRGPALAAGIITHAVDADQLDNLLNALTETRDGPACLDDFACRDTTEPIHPEVAAIETWFDADRVEEIVARIEAGRETAPEFAAETLTAMSAKSPTSLKIALRQMQVGETASFQTCMKTEYRIVSRVLKGHEVYEGIRAAIIDKDNRPVWRPDTLEAVSDSEIGAYFRPPEDGDLTFD
ncbi:MAG: enoyl-CoA hydratase/isomerase family protein [Pseudomonadota bacterium]